MTGPPPFDLPGAIREMLTGAPAAEVIAHDGRWRTRGWLAEATRAFDTALAGCATVGLVARNRPHHVAACLANLAAGRTTAMLSPGLAGAALARAIEDLAAPAVVADHADWGDAALDAARAVGTRAIATHENGGVVVDILTPGAVHDGPPRDVALELLSSGTTGPPKRIGLGWRTVAAAVSGAGATYAGSSAVAAQVMVHPLGNVSGLAYAVPPLVFGRPLVLLERFTVTGWAQAVREHRPVRGALPPAAIAMLLDSDVPRDWLASLDLIGIGGAGLDAACHEAFEARFGVPILPAYGATEFGGVIASWSIADYRRLGAAKRGSAGRAVAGVRLRIVGSDGTDCAPGDCGILEVIVERIGPDWIRTNDLARIDADGYLFIEGRADAAINRGGFKIVPETIVDLLRGHPQVRDAAVVGVVDRRLGETPVAAVEPIAGYALTSDVLDAWLRDRLPAWQVPSAVRIVEALPRTDTLKISLPGVRALFT